MTEPNIPNDTISVLLVEDDAGSRTLARRALLSNDPSVTYDISEAVNLASAKQQLSEKHFDNVILDLHLPDSTGLETLDSIKQSDPDVPIVVLSGISDHETAVESIRHGADYYLVKGQMLREMLGRSICFSVERKRRKLENENQGMLQDNIDQLHAQIREIKDSLNDQLSSSDSTEPAMQQLNGENENLFDILPIMIWYIDNNGKIVHLNKPAADLIDVNVCDVIGKDFYSLFAGNDHHARTEHEITLKDGKSSNEHMETYKSATGSLEYRLTEVVPHYDNSGNITGLIIMARNSVSQENTAKTSASHDPGNTLKEVFSSYSTPVERQAGSVCVGNPDKSKKQYSGKVLVADDDSLNSILIGSHLKDSGLDVEFASGGLEAIERSHSDDYDLVLTALTMPELDGLEVAYKLRKDNFNAPVIIMTADSSEETIEEIKKSGSTDHIFKPINKKDLFAIIDKHLAVPAATQ